MNKVEITYSKFMEFIRARGDVNQIRDILLKSSKTTKKQLIKDLEFALGIVRATKSTYSPKLPKMFLEKNLPQAILNSTKEIIDRDHTEKEIKVANKIIRKMNKISKGSRNQ